MVTAWAPGQDGRAIYLVLFGLGGTPYIVGLGGATVVAARCSHGSAGRFRPRRFHRANAMDEKQPASSWDDLIKQIGAAPAPDALERKRPAIETKFDPPPAINPAAVKPKPGDWNALADKLGVEAVEPSTPTWKKAPENDYGGPSSESLEASLAEIEPMESMFEEIIEEEISDVEFEADDDSDLDDDDSDLDDESELDDDDSDLSDEADDDDDDDVEDDEDDEDDDSETLSGEAARSAFEALFQAGSFSAMPPMKEPLAARDPQEPRRPQWRDPEEDRNAANRQDDSDERSEFNQPGGAGESAEGEASASTDERGRPRRRRRRGRGGRGKDGAPRSGPAGDREARVSSDDESDEWPGTPLGEGASAEEGERECTAEGDDGEKPTRRRRVRRRRRRGGPSEAGDAAPARAAANGRAPTRESAGDDDDEDEEDDDEMAVTESPGRVDADDDDDDDDGLPRESHKNIPTWSEAIGVMVDTNMESRKNSPSRPSGPRDRGRGRGRGGRGGGGGGGRRGKP